MTSSPKHVLMMGVSATGWLGWLRQHGGASFWGQDEASINSQDQGGVNRIPVGTLLSCSAHTPHFLTHDQCVAGAK